MAENVSLTLKSHTWELTLQPAEIDQVTGEFPYTFPFEFNRAPTLLTLKAHSYGLTLQAHPYGLTLKPHSYDLTLQGED